MLIQEQNELHRSRTPLTRFNRKQYSSLDNEREQRASKMFKLTHVRSQVPYQNHFMQYKAGKRKLRENDLQGSKNNPLKMGAEHVLNRTF